MLYVVMLNLKSQFTAAQQLQKRWKALRVNIHEHTLISFLRVPVNRFFPLRSNSDEGPLFKGLVSCCGVVTSVVVEAVVVVVVVGGRVVWTISSSVNNICQ